MEKTYVLQVTKRQLGIISQSLDIFARLLDGQILLALSNLFNIVAGRVVPAAKFTEACSQLKATVFPELERNTSYGIGYKEGDARQNNSQIAYEMEGMIRHELWKRDAERNPFATSSTPPIHYSPEPYIKLEESDRLERYEKALLYYANEANWKSNLMDGLLARETLNLDGEDATVKNEAK